MACSIIAVWVSPHSASSTDPPQTIESDDPLVLQNGTWTSVDTPNASGGSYLYSSGSPNDTLILDFYGPSIEVIYVEDPTFGSFTVEIDNTAVRTVTATGTSTVFDVRSVFEYLDDGPHTLRIMGIQGTVAIDAFIASLPPLNLPTPTPSPTPDGWTPPGGEPENFVIYDPIELPTSGCPVDEEPTEALTLIATDTLTEVANMSGLESAIDAANNGTVTTPHTICLKDGGQDDYIFTQTLVINSDINIYSSGDTDKTLKGADLFDGPLFTVQTGRTVELSHINLRDGNHSGYGGGIVNAGTLHIFDSYVDSHFSSVAGAGIDNSGTLYITRSTVSSNRSFPTSGGTGIGAAVFNNGDFTAYCTQFHYNTARYRGALTNGYFNPNATMTVNQSSFALNSGSINPIGNPNDIRNHAQTTIDATDNYWANGASVSPNTVDTTNALTYDPTEPTSLGFNPDCSPQPRPQVQTEESLCVFYVADDTTIKAYTTVVHPRTELIRGDEAIPSGISPNETFIAGNQVIVDVLYLEFPHLAEPDPAERFVVRVIAYNTNVTNTTNPVDYDAEDEGWHEIDIEGGESYLWINIAPQDIEVERVNPVDNLQDLGGDCGLLDMVTRYELDLSASDSRIEELRDYHIEIDVGDDDASQWADTEIDEILDGVSRTADAFSAAGVVGDTSQRMFFNVFLESHPSCVDNPPKYDPSDSETKCYIQFRRLFRGVNLNGLQTDPSYPNYTIGQAGHCVTRVGGSGVGSNTPSITCYGKLTGGDGVWNPDNGEVKATTVAHELGHLFVNRSGRGSREGTSLYDYVDETKNTNAFNDEEDFAIRDEEDMVVMGSFADDQGGGNFFDRGDRGWGSGPELSVFQQNPLNDPDEISADMFLNWVYRLVPDINLVESFRNKSWATNENYPGGILCSSPTHLVDPNNVGTTEGCDDSSWPGNHRFDWMVKKMDCIFFEQGWKSTIGVCDVNIEA